MSIDNQPLDNQPQDDNDDDFDSAFDEFAGGSAGEHDAPDTDGDFEGGDVPDEDDGEDAAPARQDDDADDGMTPREREMQAQMERLRHSEASQRGRLGAYQKQINELQRQVQERQTSQSTQHRGGATEGSDQEKQDMAESMGLEDWEAFEEDFPEMARAVEARLARLASARPETTQFEQRFAQYEPALQSIQQQAQEQHLKAQEDALAARHPEWREVVAAPEFAEWLGQQPQSLQQLSQSEDAAEAAALLDMYQAHAGGVAGSRTGTPDKRRDRLAAAQSVSRRGAARQGAVDDDFDAAFDHYAAKRAAR